MFFFSYPERDELKSIYSIYMSSILGLCLPKHQTWKSPAKVANLAGSMIKIYEEVLPKFYIHDPACGDSYFSGTESFHESS